MAKDVLDEKPYNYITDNFTSWEDCTIRSWLNGYDATQNVLGKDYSSDNFISTAFTSEEQARIATVQVINDTKNQYGSTGGANTMDKVFLLSVDEVKTYLGSPKGVCAKLNCTIEWWLRTPGYDSARSLTSSRLPMVAPHTGLRHTRCRTCQQRWQD
ncbi:MAG: hypothetical protein IJ268_08685 [Proteobacteria bacterium]|nr:hypothetical protein [Pseudomonadota bacterium]